HDPQRENPTTCAPCPGLCAQDSIFIRALTVAATWGTGFTAAIHRITPGRAWFRTTALPGHFLAEAPSASGSVLSNEAIAPVALNLLTQGRGLLPRCQSAEPDTIDRLAADRCLTDRGLESGQ